MTARAPSQQLLSSSKLTPTSSPLSPRPSHPDGFPFPHHTAEQRSEPDRAMSSANASSSSSASASIADAASTAYSAVKDVAPGPRKAAATPTQTAQRKDKPLYSLIAGTTAGAVEGFTTYPIEYTKTVSQFAAKAGEKAPGPITIVRNTIAKDGFIGLYSGCGALVTGNAIKAGVRFLSYDHFKTMLKDENGKLSGPRSLLAGLGAGMMEAVFAVTPSETIKTKLIDDGKRAVPKYPRGLVPGTAAIVREEGIRGIYRGLFPVMLRQGANSAVRFGTYSTLKNFVSGSARPGQSLPGGITFGIGAIAGIVTVYATMPLDVIKTRMQTLEARTKYRNTFNCAAVTLREEGVLAFWRGATPRLARLVLSGGIVFTVYEEIMSVLGAKTM